MASHRHLSEYAAADATGSYPYFWSLATGVYVSPLYRHLCPLWHLSTASLPDPLPEGALRSRSSLDTVQFMTDDSFLRNTVGDRIRDHFGGEPRGLCEGVLRQDYLKCEDPP